MLARSLTHAEDHLFMAARTRALSYAPYFAHALFSVRPVAVDGMGTFGVDRHWRLYLDPATLAEWGPANSAGVLVHEASHLIRDHALRADAIVDCHQPTWNLACDAAINKGIIASGIPLPGTPVTPDGLNLNSNSVEELYYHELLSRGVGTEGGCGSGASGAALPFELPSNDPHVAVVDPLHAGLIRRMTALAVLDHAKAVGTGTAGLDRWANDVLAGPKVSWTTILAREVRSVARQVAGATTYTYSRPSRRRLPGLVLPAMRAHLVQVAVVIDTSGSMSRDDLSAALSEVRGVIRAVGGAVHVVTCDGEASAAVQVRDVRQITLTGGGGTDMRVGIAAALDLRPRPDAVVVLTDGYTPWPSMPTPVPLITAIIGNGPPGPTWATTVRASAE